MSEKSKLEASIENEVHLFTRHIDSLVDTLPAAMVLLQNTGKLLKDQLDEFEAKNCKIEKGEKETKVEIPLEHYKKWKKLYDRHERFHLARAGLAGPGLYHPKP
ncbi:MAG TPA: hypothetical protein VHE58_11510 [Burkholderiales bacterium]|nr:hypothetical protein [Burkholderiales bacterium]